MRALLQRVTGASVEADRQVIGSIDRGLVTLLGVAAGDGPEDVRYLADKILHLRIFEDEHGKFQHSLLDARGGCLLVSQFTLLANTRRGRRPDFLGAAAPEVAAPRVKDVAEHLRGGGVPVVEGRFGAHMVVRLAHDGPVTIFLDSRERGA
jgi:D-tyrosyl-tRNA(Tyr) deacylase